MSWCYSCCAVPFAGPLHSHAELVVLCPLCPLCSSPTRPLPPTPPCHQTTCPLGGTAPPRSCCAPRTTRRPSTSLRWGPSWRSSSRCARCSPAAQRWAGWEGGWLVVGVGSGVEGLSWLQHDGGVPSLGNRGGRRGGCWAPAVHSEVSSTCPPGHCQLQPDELYKICSVMGTPTAATWPEGLQLAQQVRQSMEGRQALQQPVDHKTHADAHPGGTSAAMHGSACLSSCMHASLGSGSPAA